MDRDEGLRRSTVITGALVAASLAGTLAVGLAARAAESTDSSVTSDSGTTAGSVSDSGTTPGSASDSGTTSGSGPTVDSPPLSTGGDRPGQATTGGS